MEDKILKGIIGLVGILLGLGGSVVFSQDQIDNSYVCTVNERLGVFEGNDRHPEALSDTSKTGYYINSDGEDKYSVCRNGYWKSLKDYAYDKGVSPDTFLLNVNIEPDVVSIDGGEVNLRDSCPSVAIVAYTDVGKFYCTAPGPYQVCEDAADLELPLYK